MSLDAHPPLTLCRWSSRHRRWRHAGMSLTVTETSDLCELPRSWRTATVPAANIQLNLLHGTACGHTSQTAAARSIHATAPCQRPRGQLHRSTFMLTVCDSVLGLTPGLQLRARHGRAVTGRGTATAVHCRRAPKAFHFVFCSQLSVMPCTVQQSAPCLSRRPIFTAPEQL